AEGLIDKGEFEPRITRLRQRLGHCEEQARRLTDELRVQDDLRLLVGQLETFAAQVRQGLEAADWLTCRELSPAPVERVEVEPGQVKVVFRVPPAPFAASPETRVLPRCRWGEDATLGRAGERVPLDRILPEDAGPQERLHQRQDTLVPDPSAHAVHESR